MYNDFCLKISTKKTDMYYVQRIGFLTGPNVNLASLDLYIKEILQLAKLDLEVIEIKKKITFEKKTSSKVLMIYAVQDKAQEIDEQIYNTTFSRFKYISYCLLLPAQ